MASVASGMVGSDGDGAGSLESLLVLLLVSLVVVVWCVFNAMYESSLLPAV